MAEIDIAKKRMPYVAPDSIFESFIILFLYIK